MVDRHGVSLACVGSRHAPISPLEVIRTHGNISIERDLAEGAKLLLLSKPIDPKQYSNQSAAAGTQSQPQPHHHGRNRKSSSLERKNNKVSSASSINSSEDSSSSGGLTPPKPAVKKHPAVAATTATGSVTVPSTSILNKPLPPPSKDDKDEEVVARPVRHGHRRSLSTSEHLHFAGKAGPPTLSAAAFEPKDDDESDEEEESEDNDNIKNDGGSVIEVSVHEDGERTGASAFSTASANRLNESSAPDRQVNSPASAGSVSQSQEQQHQLTVKINPIAKGPLSRVVSTETGGALSPTSILRIGSNSPHYRPRRSSAPDLDSIVENMGSEAEEEPIPSPPKSTESTRLQRGITPFHSDKSGGSDSTRSNRSRRHYRQLSAPVVVGGGVDADGDDAPASGNVELKLPDGLVITRSGISSNASTPDRSLHPLNKRSPPPPRVGSQFKLDKTEDEETPTGMVKSNSQSPSGSSVPTALSSTPRTGPGLFNADELETLGVLGRGTAGIVTKALHVSALRIVAVKSIQKFDAHKRETTIAEVRALYNRMIPFTSEPESMMNENIEEASCIVGFYDAFIPENGAAVNLVLEWMDGGSLQDLIDKKKAQGTTLPEEFIAVACRRMLKGLCELFDQRLLHRDMKPANVLVSRSGSIKLSDFGVSLSFGQGENSNAKTFVGSLSYMAPERVHSAEYSYASDLWSVGLITYVCATGVYPFTKDFDEHGFFGIVQAVAEEPPALDPHKFSPELVDFVAKCLDRDPNKRPTAQEHLKHPFVQKFIDRPDLARKAVADQLAPVDQIAARTELNRLISIAVDYHIKNALKHQLTMPRFTTIRVQGLASQLGVVFADSKELEQLVDAINSRMLTAGTSPSAFLATGTSPASVVSSQSSSSSPRAAANISSLWKKNNLKLDLTM